MKRLLLEGTTLIVDRYAFSGVAYSAAKPVRNTFSIFFTIRFRYVSRQCFITLMKVSKKVVNLYSA